MKIDMKVEKLKNELKKREGVYRLAPVWVPRSFLMPGGRLKLHPHDIFILGSERGGIDERWLASTTNAANGPGTPKDEGLSYIVIEEGNEAVKILLKEAVELIGDELLGKDVMGKYGGWMVLCKFFDNLGPIPHHMHQMDEHAEKVGRLGKPEAYYFPIQLNLKANNFPYTFFGLEPETTKWDVRRCLENWNRGDNGILEYSKAYRLKSGTGWSVPPGVLHAPGSLVTYEPQRASDVFGMFQSMVEGRFVPWELLVKDVPEDKSKDLDYIINMLDWEKNVDPEFKNTNYREAKPVKDIHEMQEEGYMENWVVYGSEYFTARELTVFPGRSVAIKDDGAYGVILMQGKGQIGKKKVETPTIIRYGELTRDEFFVSFHAAKQGVVITNSSECENLVMLKHFGP
ncbi:MAG: hypothetical protein Q7J78_04900 [Clostridiales bacterium]|nr:hypothetical protein [Clostridiales bacterium]